MIISHRYKFIFFACGKTGTTSIESVLTPYHDSDDVCIPLREAVGVVGGNPKHARPEMVKEYLPGKLWSEYFKFVFVRNPWDWVVSQYYFSNFKKQKRDIFTNKIHARHVHKVWNRLRTGNPYDPCDSVMQHAYVFGRDGRRLVDFIGHFERLTEDFGRICDHLNIPQHELPAKNTTKHRPYQKLYTMNARRRVGSLYEKDIRLLGYEFDQTPPSEGI